MSTCNLRLVAVLLVALRTVHCGEITRTADDISIELVREGEECASSDRSLVPAGGATLDVCAKACLDNPPCKYFIWGITNGKCYMETTASAACAEGFYTNEYNFYILHDATGTCIEPLCTEGTELKSDRQVTHEGGLYYCDEVNNAIAKGETGIGLCTEARALYRPQCCADPDDDSEAETLSAVDYTAVSINPGFKCSSQDFELGTFSTVFECAGACANSPPCKYFTYGNSGRENPCIWEQTTDATCPEEFVEYEGDFFELPDVDGTCPDPVCLEPYHLLADKEVDAMNGADTATYTCEEYLAVIAAGEFQHYLCYEAVALYRTLCCDDTLTESDDSDYSAGRTHTASLSLLLLGPALLIYHNITIMMM